MNKNHQNSHWRIIKQRYELNAAMIIGGQRQFIQFNSIIAFEFVIQFEICNGIYLILISFGICCAYVCAVTIYLFYLFNFLFICQWNCTNRWWLLRSRFFNWNCRLPFCFVLFKLKNDFWLIIPVRKCAKWFCPEKRQSIGLREWIGKEHFGWWGWWWLGGGFISRQTAKCKLIMLRIDPRDTFSLVNWYIESFHFCWYFTPRLTRFFPFRFFGIRKPPRWYRADSGHMIMHI